MENLTEQDLKFLLETLLTVSGAYNRAENIDTTRLYEIAKKCKIDFKWNEDEEWWYAV